MVFEVPNSEQGGVERKSRDEATPESKLFINQEFHSHILVTYIASSCALL